MATQLRPRIRTLPRPAGTDADGADDPDGQALAGRVRDVLSLGGGAVAVVARPDRTELVDLRGVVEARLAVPLPPGVRRWWSLGRRTGNVVHCDPADVEDSDDRPAPIVH
jgi:hypothetical protein